MDATDLNNLQLCNAVPKISQHIAIVTDILRDVDGNVHIISVSESTPPVCVTKDFTPEEFKCYWLGSGYRVFSTTPVFTMCPTRRIPSYPWTVTPTWSALPSTPLCSP